MTTASALSILLLASLNEVTFAAWKLQWPPALPSFEHIAALWPGKLCENQCDSGCNLKQGSSSGYLWSASETSATSATRHNTKRGKCHELSSELERCKTEKLQAEEELLAAGIRLREFELELRQEKIQFSKREEDLQRQVLEMQIAKQSAYLRGCVATIALIVACISSVTCVWSRRQLRIVCVENTQNKKRLFALQDEFDWELGGAIKLNHSPRIVHPDIDLSEGDAVRTVKIFCPVAHPSDIEIDVICNGCTITVTPQPSCADSAWTKKIQFRPSEGLCEFKSACFEGEFLKIIFQTRRVHRAHHFDLTNGGNDTDLSIFDAASDGAWLCSGTGQTCEKGGRYEPIES